MKLVGEVHETFQKIIQELDTAAIVSEHGALKGGSA